MILLIDNYDSFTYNIKQYIEELGYTCVVYRNDAITLEQIAALKPQSIVISPGPGDPDSAGITLEVIRRFAGEIPILGVCLGHQAIGQVFGGNIVRARQPKHGKISKVTHSGQGIFNGLPSPFRAARYHSLVIEKESLPSCLEVSAETEDGTIMAVRHREMNIHGVQFHPESIATECGREMFLEFLKMAG
jgi:anthranilate synthase/aminodeoxychorismate synthase-like glutamine amidotransferase